MLHQILFLLTYLAMLPTILVSPFAGVLIYKWLENLTPVRTYSVTLVTADLSLIVGVLTFFVWLVKEKKTFPRPPLLILVLAALFVWINITSFFALAPDAAAVKWDRTVKVIGFAILTAQMLSTRARLEAFVWVLVLCVAYFAVPGAIKTIASDGGGQVGGGMVVVGDPGSFLGDRVPFAVVLAMMLPFALYLGRQTTLLPPSRWLRPAMVIVAAGLLIALIGTFARTALLAGGAALLMLVAKSRRKAGAAVVAGVVVLFLVALAPETWFARMDTTVHYQQDASAEDRIDAWVWAWHMALAHPIVGGGFRVFVLDAGHLIPGATYYLEAHNIFFEMMAENGFVGLGLFCCLLFAGYRSCATISRRVRGHHDLVWAGDLARTVQVGLVAFTVGGQFVSISTSPFLYDLLALAIGVRSLVERGLSAAVLPKMVSGLPRPAAKHPAE